MPPRPICEYRGCGFRGRAAEFRGIVSQLRLRPEWRKSCSRSTLLSIWKCGAPCLTCSTAVEIRQALLHYLGDMMFIRPVVAADADGIWEVLEPAFRAGETYTVPPEITREEALAYWLAAGHETFVAEENGRIVGTY